MTTLSWMLSFSLVALAGTNTQAKAPKVATSPGMEQLRGFPELLSREIGRSFKEATLARGTGYPVEPGYYVTMTRERLQVLDKAQLPLKEGQTQDPAIAGQSRAGSSAAFWTLFAGLWRESQRVDQRARFVHPRRVHWALEQELPLKSFLDSAYAALETWPGSTLPAMYLLLDAGPGGVRSRQFRLMPPGGVDTAAQNSALEFRIQVFPQERYAFSARSSSFALAGDTSGLTSLSAKLSQVKRRYPGKRAVVLEATPGSTVADLAKVMDATLELFPEVILDIARVHEPR